MAADSADEIVVISDDEAKVEEEDYGPALDETEEKHQEMKLENSETGTSDVNAEDEGSSEEEDDEEHEGNGSYKAQEETTINQILDNLKVHLTDGTIAPMFSRGPLYFHGQWPISCHVCKVHGIVTLKRLKIHINKRHHKRIMEKMPLDAVRYKQGLKQVYSTKRPKLNNLILIFPGEKITEITPELQDRILPVRESPFLPLLNNLSKMQLNSLSKWEPLHIYNQKAPLIGLSYCFKMHYHKVSGYYCSLCDVHCTHSIYNHVIGEKHRVKYVDKHFPRLVARISFYLVDMNSQKVKQNIIHEIIRNIYRSIEFKRGLRKVHMHELRSYTQLCARYCARCLHYGDNHVLTTDAELKEMVEKCLRGENLLPPDPPNIMGESQDLITAEPSEDSSRSMKEEPLEKRVPRLEDRNWDRYQRMLGSALDEIEEKYSNYKMMPENHPAYGYEWRKFWSRRVQEIENDNLKLEDHDLEREWMPYWKELMQYYHTTAINKAKFRTKQILRIPSGTRSPKPIRNQRTRRHGRASSSVLATCSRRTRSRSPAGNERPREPPEDVAESLETTGVISVLRLLTALENSLGSLGPKATDYLSQSLLYEKNSGHSANRLLLKEEYYIFFITAKEKLKGQLIAQILKKQKKTAAINAIKEINTLIEMFDEYCKRHGRTAIAQPQNVPPQTFKQESRLNADDQDGARSQNDYSKNRQPTSQMDQFRSSEGNNSNQDGRSQNQHGTASANQLNAAAPNSNQSDQNRSMTAHPNQVPNQYSQGSQGGVWQSGTNVTFLHNANQGNQPNPNFCNVRDGNLTISFGGNPSLNPDMLSGVNYNSNLGSIAGSYNYSSLGAIGNLNTLHGGIWPNINDNIQLNQAHGLWLWNY